ncbi:hypothetical protein ElyMa_002971100 [Elysia marginata]|uniref:RNase H type-1 domain-containing protein n=1 Tax=Elysia marginata TaxID=1093978 RepID=A0AAV4I9V0_9GAST|nr:hypothetical protein ElyMa_002971100 [Elysia marginata]
MAKKRTKPRRRQDRFFSNFKTKLIAIKTTLEHIKRPKHTCREQEHIHFFDSQAAPSKSRARTYRPTSDSIAPHLKNLNIGFQWISSHIGILGNQRADRLAKQGCKKPQTA